MAKSFPALATLAAVWVSRCVAAYGADEPAVAQDPSATFVALNDWDAGYCGELRVRSEHREVRDWQVIATVRGAITTVGNGSYHTTEENEHGAFRPANWNNVIPIGGESTIVICGSGEYPEIHGVHLG